MQSRVIRTLLVVVAIVVGLAAAYFLKTIESSITGERTSTDVVRAQGQDVTTTLGDIRTAQTAYVARGQGEAFWMERVSKLLPTLDQQMNAFRATLTSPVARGGIEPATAAIENLQKLDARAQEYVKSGQVLLASDLIFSDGLDAASTATKQIEQAVSDEIAARQANVAELRNRELLIVGSGAGAMLLVLLVLGFSGARGETVEMPISLKDTASEPAAMAPMAPPPVEPIPAAKTPNLGTIAKLCSDLARVHESSELPRLLERTAQAIDASGMIVWIADPGGDQLRPSVSFGYAQQVIAKMGCIAREATNAAAAAYRTGEMRTVAGDGVSHGALIAPLVTADGCIGVLSAEMKGGSEKDESSQSLVSIVAAQLATLVSPSPSAALDQTAAEA